MMPASKTAWLLLALAACAPAAADQVYKWTDEHGTVNYTPYPPPASARDVQQKRVGGNSIQTSGVPYGLQEAVKNFPISLYTTSDCGEPCDQARAHLKKRGVPFTEKNPQLPDENENFKKLSGSGDTQVPLMIVGSLRNVKGYLASDYDAALDQAGYPKTSALPPSATLPMPTPAAPAPAPAENSPPAPAPAP